MPDFQGPLFIVGMPRSGTKLLRGIINRHDRISIPDAETEFLPYWVANWDRFGDLSERRCFERFSGNCRSLPYFIYRDDAGEAIDTESWYRNCSDFTPAGVFEALVRESLHITPGDNTIWGDKSPSYLTRLTLLRECFPQAKFVHIIRDVRDYCLSMNSAWGKNMYRAAQRWSDDVSACRADGATFGNDYLEVRYEDLLEDPDGTIRQVCAFLGIPYGADLLDISDSVERVGDARGKAGIVRGNARKFESKLPSGIRNRIEAIAGQTLQQAGYDCTYDRTPHRLPSWQLRFLQALDGLNLIAFEARQRGWVQGSRFVLRYFQISGNR